MYFKAILSLIFLQLNIYFSQEKYRKVVYNKKDIEFIKKTQKKFKEKYRKKEKNHE